MSNFFLPHNFPFPGTLVQVPHILHHRDLLAFRPFTDWLTTLSKSFELQSSNPTHPFHSSPYRLHSINIQAVDFFHPAPGSKKARIGFLKLQADISNTKQGSCLASQGQGGGEADEYVVLTVQPRVPAGSLSFVELPAGMIDDAGSFTGAAAKEIKEETGLDIKEDELIDLTKLASESASSDSGSDSNSASKTEGSNASSEAALHSETLFLRDALYTSPGGSDEFVPVLAARKVLTRRQIEELQGKTSGLSEEGEKITLKLVKLKDLWKVGAKDAKTVAAWGLWEGLKREGKI